MDVNAVVESAGRMAQAKMLATKFSPVQWEAVAQALKTNDAGYLPLKTGLVYEVDGEPVISYLNRANVRSLAKANVVEPTYAGGTKVSNITGMKLTKFGYLVAEQMKEVQRG